MGEPRADFPFTRIYTDKDGESRFEDLCIPLRSQGEIGFLSEKLKARSILFRHVVPGYNYDFHNAPKRQFIFLLDGVIQIESSLGKVRTFSAGDVLLVEDTRGKGHRTKNLTPIKRRSVFVEIPEDLDIISYLAEDSEAG